MSRAPRRAEPRIDKSKPLLHPRRHVSLRVAADFLEVDRKTLNVYLANRKLAYTWFGTRRKIEVAELVAFLARQRVDRQAS
jgi:helix-turn-helix protein